MTKYSAFSYQPLLQPDLLLSPLLLRLLLCIPRLFLLEQCVLTDEAARLGPIDGEA
jgi:hypothetical protein